MEHPSGVNINFILNTDDEYTENILMDIPKKYAGYTHVALEVSDVESALHSIKSLDIAITGQVEFEAAKFLVIRDPDNNVIEFHQSSSIN